MLDKVLRSVFNLDGVKLLFAVFMLTFALSFSLGFLLLIFTMFFGITLQQILLICCMYGITTGLINVFVVNFDC